MVKKLSYTTEFVRSKALNKRIPAALARSEFKVTILVSEKAETKSKFLFNDIH